MQARFLESGRHRTDCDRSPRCPGAHSRLDESTTVCEVHPCGTQAIWEIIAQAKGVGGPPE